MDVLSLVKFHAKQIYFMVRVKVRRLFRIFEFYKVGLCSNANEES